MQFVNGRRKGAIAAGAIPLYSRVKFSSINANGDLVVDVAAAADTDLGVADELPAFAAGQPIPFTLRQMAGTVGMLASGSITAGNPVYPDASGKISGSSVAYNSAIGIALQTASGNGSIIEVLRIA